MPFNERLYYDGYLGKDYAHPPPIKLQTESSSSIASQIGSLPK
ncbi:MAG: hypothetical protein N3A69_17775 [Leptospiraceae bacterium]|nr:hypothetical protein [Leptospiraceae bacterium]